MVQKPQEKVGQGLAPSKIFELLTFLDALLIRVDVVLVVGV